MTGIASRGQLRMTFLRTALLIVPAVLLLGSLSGWLSGSGSNNAWYQALAKPSWTPPGGSFALAWTVLYVLMGTALATVVYARGSPGRGAAIGLFALQFALNLAWSPTFFGAHRVDAGFWLILAILAAATATTAAFFRIRRRAGWLMVPYLAWLGFAALLNYEVWTLNPGAEQRVPGTNSAEFAL